MSSKDIEEPLLENLRSEIHLWCCCPEEITNKSTLDKFYSILSVEERDKHQRFHFEKDRHSYLVSHALVRKVLSSYCTIRPEEWCFTTNEYGKPDISADIKSPPLKFNLSHTDGMIACVVSFDIDCGVDVENIQRKSKVVSVAERMFAQQEVDKMQCVTEAESQSKFFDFWTLREAYVKALGTGLGGSSKEFYFTLVEQGETDVSTNRLANINFVNSKKNQSTDWQFLLLKPSDEHVASVAINTSLNRKIISQTVQL